MKCHITLQNFQLVIKVIYLSFDFSRHLAFLHLEVQGRFYDIYKDLGDYIHALLDSEEIENGFANE